MHISRRKSLNLILGSTAAILSVNSASASTYEFVDVLIDRFTDGEPVANEGFEIIVPELVENGAKVPVKINAVGAQEIMIIAPENVVPIAATFKFGKLSFSEPVGTNIRLAVSQPIIAVAKLADGSFASVRKDVKITLGGCGG